MGLNLGEVELGGTWGGGMGRIEGVQTNKEKDMTEQEKLIEKALRFGHGFSQFGMDKSRGFVWNVSRLESELRREVGDSTLRLVAHRPSDKRLASFTVELGSVDRSFYALDPESFTDLLERGDRESWGNLSRYFCFHLLEQVKNTELRLGSLSHLHRGSEVLVWRSEEVPFAPHLYDIRTTIYERTGEVEVLRVTGYNHRFLVGEGEAGEEHYFQWRDILGGVEKC